MEYFPKIHADYEVYLECLPLGKTSEFYPFAGIVLNINAASIAHRDVGDDRLCVVIPFGNFTGGELVLYELGVVLELKAGDILLFNSVEITHFNLLYKGFRGSMVLHTDREWPNYVENDQAGWKDRLV